MKSRILALLFVLFTLVLPVQAGTPIPAGFPKADNTGPIGAGLSYNELTISGGMTVTVDGAVIDKLDIAGSITVKADNVTIKRCRLTSSSWYVIKPLGKNCTIEYCELKGGTTAGVGGGQGYTLRYCNVYGAHDGLKVPSNTVIEYSYIHDQWKEAGSHNDALQNSGGGSHQVIRFNTILGPYRQTNAALQFATNFGPIDDVLLEGNILSGGNWMIRMGDKGNGHGCPTNIRFTNNIVDTDSYTLGPLSTGGCSNITFTCNRTLKGDLFTSWNPTCATGISVSGIHSSEMAGIITGQTILYNITGRKMISRGFAGIYLVKRDNHLPLKKVIYIK
jgi:hypothetical protein